MATANEHRKDTRERLCLSVSETAKILGISRGPAYELARSGQLPVVRLGRRLLVPRAALERMLAQTTPAGDGQKVG